MNIYREEILEEYKNPQNFHRIVNPTYSSKEVNPFCGDDIEIFITSKEGQATDISFVGKGCAISIAAASLLTQFAKDKTITDLKKMSEDEMLDLLGVDISESRKKCALLAFATLKDAIK